MMNSQVAIPEAGERSAEILQDEQEMVRAIRSGDRRAAEELVDRTYRFVFAVLVRLCDGNSDLASDLTQETYRKAWQSLSSFDGRARVSTWLHRIAYTTFLNHVRTPRRVEPLSDDAERTIASTDPPPDEVLSSSEDDRALRAAVIALPDELRYVVTAHYWGGLSVTDIAQHERITTVAIRKRLKKAFSLIEAALQRGRS